MADDSFSRRSLERAGFRGFVTFDALEPSTVSPEPGVYVVLRPADSQPTFLEVSVGGHFKGRDPSVPVQLLEKRWVADAAVLYIGKATSLRTRLRQLREFGRGRPIGHWGGRYIWQIGASGELVVAWRPCPNPGGEEGRLLRAFEARYGSLPFANIARGELAVDGDDEVDPQTVTTSFREVASSSVVTAPELARQLDVDPKRLRSWLRRQGWRSPAEHGTQWLLDEHQARAARHHFGRG